jgi:hypothetical protein
LYGLLTSQPGLTQHRTTESSHEADTDNGTERFWFQKGSTIAGRCSKYPGSAIECRGHTWSEAHPSRATTNATAPRGGRRISYTRARMAKPASTMRSFGIAEHASHCVEQIER